MKMHRSTSSSRFVLLLLTVAFFLSLPGRASAQEADPPSRVGRLNYIEGSVSFQPAGTSDWLDANPNRPLTTGDQLWADENSRGELHMGGSVLRISSQTGISFLNLSDQAVQIQVAQGSADLRVLHLEDNETYELDTPNLAYTILRPGDYRVDVNPDGTSSVVQVISGAGEVTAGGTAYNVAPGQRYVFSGTDLVNYEAAAAPGPDAFEHWSQEREQREDKMASAQYVSRDVIGYEDLDDHGRWDDDATYGHVWVPTGVAADWAPYRDGHWAFVAPWGWTWVDDEPWGFAPFHYGRWAHTRGGWAWVPGPVQAAGVVYVRPVYAPALVAFVGGGGFSASIEVGRGAGVAWFPLGPRDVWVPGYHVSEAYMTRVNVSNSRVINRTEITNVYTTTIVNKNVNVNRTYMNQNAPGAVTAVPRATFQNGEPVARSAVRMNSQQIEHPQVVAAAATTPTPRAVAGPSAPARASARPPATLASRPVVTKMAPSARAIPVGHTAPASASTYRSMPNAKPATTPAGRPADTTAAKPTVPPTAQPTPNRNQPPARENTVKQPAPGAAKPAPPPAKQPATTTERPAEQPAPNRVEPPAHENTVKQPAPGAAKPTPPPAKQPAISTERPAEQPPPNRAQPPAHENTVKQPPPAAARPAPPPAKQPATSTERPAEQPPPNRAQPPAHENTVKQPPPAAAKATPPPARQPATSTEKPAARATEPPATKPAPTKPQPPAHENEPKQPPPAAKPTAPAHPDSQAKKPSPPKDEKEKNKDNKDNKDKEPPRQ